MGKRVQGRTQWTDEHDFASLSVVGPCVACGKKMYGAQDTHSPRHHLGEEQG